MVTNCRPIGILSCMPKVFESLISDFCVQILGILLSIKSLVFFLKDENQIKYTVIHRLDSLEGRNHVNGLPKTFKKFRTNCYCGLDHTCYIRVQTLIHWKFKFHPQRSHLSPLIFNLYVNDLASCSFYGHFLLFVHDSKLFQNIC